MFELDSVRKTDEEIITGQKALYNEITKNGNVVVLSYNQFVDSRGFFSLLSDADYYQNLLTLFEKGAIRISQYGGIRTIVQYITNAIDDDENQFIYSALPLKYEQKHLTALVRRSLIHSDLSEINSYLSNDISESKLRDLFIEYDGKNVYHCVKKISELQEILRNLYSLLSLVLQLSAMHHIYISPRNPDEYKNYRFLNILNIVLNFDPPKNDLLWSDACDCIRSLDCYPTNNNRSVYLRELKKMADTSPEKTKPCQYAEAIVDICHNYSIENSICNVSKHYNVCELDPNSTSQPTFYADFLSRLAQIWNNGQEADKKFLLEETNVFEQFKKQEDIPDFSAAVHVVDYVDLSKAVQDTPCQKVPRYEQELDAQRKRLAKGIKKQLFIRLGIFVLYGFLAMLLAVTTQCIQTVWDTFISPSQAISSIKDIVPWLFKSDTTTTVSVASTFGFSMETILLLFLGEWASNVLSKQFSLSTSLSDAVRGIRGLWSDHKTLLRSSGETYTSPPCQKTSYMEPFTTPLTIDYYESQEIKKYRRWKQTHPDLVKDSPIYPIANTDDRSIVSELMRLQELYNYRFGVVYKSRYNTMVVDPIQGGSQGFFAYERTVPSADKDGIVVMAMYQEKFVLLRQYRHAIRQEQYSFPRGYAEPNETTVETVQRELEEELHTVITNKPLFMGRIAADSGLTSCQAYVFLAEIDSPTIHIGHEGIVDYLLLSPNELKARIQKQEITDSFTLGAFAMYEAQKTNQTE